MFPGGQVVTSAAKFLSRVHGSMETARLLESAHASMRVARRRSAQRIALARVRRHSRAKLERERLTPRELDSKGQVSSTARASAEHRAASRTLLRLGRSGASPDAPRLWASSTAPSMVWSAFIERPGCGQTLGGAPLQLARRRRRRFGPVRHGMNGCSDGLASWIEDRWSMIRLLACPPESTCRSRPLSSSN